MLFVIIIYYMGRVILYIGVQTMYANLFIRLQLTIVIDLVLYLRLYLGFSYS